MPVLDFDYADHQGLLEHIRKINHDYYNPVVDNIEFLRTSYKRSFPVHAIGLRDAYSHLAVIFECADILNPDSKRRIKRQLERYLGHLEALLYDIYLKIIKEKSTELFDRYHDAGRDQNLPKMRMEVGSRVQKIRIVDDKTDVNDKIDNFNKIINFIEAYPA